MWERGYDAELLRTGIARPRVCRPIAPQLPTEISTDSQTDVLKLQQVVGPPGIVYWGLPKPHINAPIVEREVRKSEPIAHAPVYATELARLQKAVPHARDVYTDVPQRRHSVPVVRREIWTPNTVAYGHVAGTELPRLQNTIPLGRGVYSTVPQRLNNTSSDSVDMEEVPRLKTLFAPAARGVCAEDPRWWNGSRGNLVVEAERVIQCQRCEAIEELERLLSRLKSDPCGCSSK
jgi:hypothetical protein